MKQTEKPELAHNSIPPKTEEGEGEEEEEDEGTRVSEGNRPKRERRQNCNSATLCQVCNIQLNSRAQAQIHYRGKTHQRKLRRLAKAVSTGRDEISRFQHKVQLNITHLHVAARLSSTNKYPRITPFYILHMFVHTFYFYIVDLFHFTASFYSYHLHFKKSIQGQTVGLNLKQHASTVA